MTVACSTSSSTIVQSSSRPHSWQALVRTLDRQPHRHFFSAVRVTCCRVVPASWADVERRNRDGETALGYAASWGSIDTVRLLVEAGADVNAIEERGCYSTALVPLARLTRITTAEIREFLREHGPKVQ
ncbi:MAG: ankyrin repeat domain-containing protein [Verrucomicrobia bacterium]|nr:ankyrin repeat domain-containing protein [Verrucomicrobiota bacterium]